MEFKIQKNGKFKVKLNRMPDESEISWMNELKSEPGEFLIRVEEDGHSRLVKKTIGKHTTTCQLFEWLDV